MRYMQLSLKIHLSLKIFIIHCSKLKVGNNLLLLSNPESHMKL